MPWLWEDLDELKAQLRALPHELAAEGAEIVERTAEAAAAEMRATYPERTGNLRKGVKVQKTNTSEFGAVATVVNTAPHSYIFEHGTVARHTDIGADRGSMPPGHVFIPIVERRRRDMYLNDFAELLERAGLTVELDNAA
jgi:Bacteriophage HK97-gp10, putative tail-component